MQTFASWKALMLLSILFWGLWGFLGKIALVRIGWGPAFLVVADLAVILMVKPESFLFRLNTDYFLGALMALAGSLGGLFFYQALEKGPATVVVPGTALYIVFAAALALIFLHEPLTWNRVLGLGCGLLAIFLLSRG